MGRANQEIVSDGHRSTTRAVRDGRITGVLRTTGRALGPLFAGLLFTVPVLINQLAIFASSALNIGYDLLLY